ncbi:hypothetical protein J32TS6_41760 [Virgibacillus pantothenticus]|uniref:hypothetical protein n=1 Tax=Virgibacillus pantothenticus TaxID=1473 RepID=UPI000FFF1DDE|nr:hypothetical protein [Virgibacillus pantothenticus]GIP65621.1 hypothetical protein J32TS6_41760 [Virgibacillus pantothenticus]
MTKEVGLKSKITIDEDSLVVMEEELLKALIHSSQCFFEMLFNDLKLKSYKQELLERPSIGRVI